MRPWCRRAARAGICACALVAVACCLLNGLYSSTETDKWFLLATGRLICRDGIPHANPWSIDSAALGVVVQQWLHDVILWRAYDAAGTVGVALVVLATSALAITAAVNEVCAFAGRTPGQVSPWRLLACVGAFCVMAVGWLTLRPNVWTMAASLLAMATCERTRRDGRLSRLLLLPLIMVTLMQLHMSMAWLAAFVVGVFALPADATELPRLATREGRADYLCAHGPFLVACVVMVLVMPLNPYGLDGMLYLFRSFGAASYGNLILEMKPIWDPAMREALVGFALRAAILLASAALCARRHALRPDLALLGTACLVASALQARNGWLVALPACAMLGTAVGLERDEAGKAPHGAAAVALAWVGAACAALVATSGGAAGWDSLPTGMQPLLDDVEAAEGSRDVRVMCSDTPLYNYMEWEGWRVMLDARPEIWEPPITGDGDHRYRAWADAIGVTSTTRAEAERSLLKYVRDRGVGYVIAQDDVRQGASSHGERDGDFYASLPWLERVASTGTMTLYRVSLGGLE